MWHLAPVSCFIFTKTDSFDKLQKVPMVGVTWNAQSRQRWTMISVLLKTAQGQITEEWEEKCKICISNMNLLEEKVLVHYYITFFSYYSYDHCEDFVDRISGSSPSKKIVPCYVISVLSWKECLETCRHQNAICAMPNHGLVWIVSYHLV